MSSRCTGKLDLIPIVSTQISSRRTQILPGPVDPLSSIRCVRQVHVSEGPINPARINRAQGQHRRVVGIHQTTNSLLSIGNFPQSSDGRSNGSGRWGTEGVGSSSVDFSTRLALPDTDGSSLDSVLYYQQMSSSLKYNRLTFPQDGQLYRACWVISIFLTLYSQLWLTSDGARQLNVRLSEGSTVSRSVLSGNTNLFRSFSLDN